ncbi:hypothetical protein [Haliea sp. E17]|uniref:hypothetical protein n=1 Tax=Haliea sp. E17 TaxID=3401576 RepID=UPI003AB0338C
MEPGKAIGEFTLNITSTTFSDSLQEGTRINLDGTMSNGGNVIGTLTFRNDGPPTYETGKADWLGATTAKDGDVVPNSGRGYYLKTGPGQYRLRLLTQETNGNCALVEGQLTAGHYSGVVYAW